LVGSPPLVRLRRAAVALLSLRRGWRRSLARPSVADAVLRCGVWRAVQCSPDAAAAAAAAVLRRPVLRRQSARESVQRALARPVVPSGGLALQPEGAEPRRELDPHGVQVAVERIVVLHLRGCGA
jgi:hypothetical protein